MTTCQRASQASPVVTKSLHDIGQGYIGAEEGWADARLADAGLKETEMQRYKQVRDILQAPGRELEATEKELDELRDLLNALRPEANTSSGDPYADGVDLSNPNFDPVTGLPDPAYWAYLKEKEPHVLVNMGLDPDAPVGVDVPPGTYGTDGSLIATYANGASNTPSTTTRTERVDPSLGDGPSYPTYQPQDDPGTQVDQFGTDITAAFDVAFGSEESPEVPFVTINDVSYLEDISASSAEGGLPEEAADDTGILLGDVSDTVQEILDEADEFVTDVASLKNTSGESRFAGGIDFDAPTGQTLYAQQLIEMAQAGRTLTPPERDYLNAYESALVQRIQQGNRRDPNEVAAFVAERQRLIAVLENESGQRPITQAQLDEIFYVDVDDTLFEVEEILDDIWVAFDDVQVEKEEEEEPVGLGAIQTTDSPASTFDSAPIIWEAVRFDAVTFDPVTSEAVTFDPVTSEAVTFEAVTSEAVEYSGNPVVTIGEQYLGGGGLSFTYDTDTSSWDDWIDAVGRANLERLVGNTKYPEHCDDALGLETAGHERE